MEDGQYSTEDSTEISIDYMSVLESFVKNRAVRPPMYYFLITIYSCMIFIGALGNIMVICAVLRKPTMRTTRNVFIFNLAVSDLFLCVLTMPFTLIEVLTRYWPFGNTAILCKVTGSLQGISIFVSTLSITAIAIDRYYLVVYPTKEALNRRGAFWVILGIWMTSMVLALPMFICRKVRHVEVPIDIPGVSEINYCMEEWPYTHGRFSYSVLTMIIQYALPIITVSVAYGKIARQLKMRMKNRMTADKNKREIEDKRVQKTNLLLISIACAFALSWLPLNVYNTVMDFMESAESNSERVKISYAICHLLGMSSACSNPLLYGWLNDNFRKEFFEILQKLKLCRETPCENMKRCSTVRSSYKKAVKGKAPVIVYTKATTTPTPSDIQTLKQDLNDFTVMPTTTSNLSDCQTPTPSPGGSPTLLRVTNLRFSAH